LTADWLQFAGACTGVIFGGFFSVRYADRLGDLTGFGKVWAGAVLLAPATSLPELVTGVSAVSAQEAPDLSAGGVFGAAVINLTTIGALGLRPRWRAMLTLHSTGTWQLAVLGLVIAVTSGALVLLGRPSVGLPAGVLIPLPLVLMVTYAAGSYRLHSRGAGPHLADLLPERAGELTAMPGPEKVALWQRPIVRAAVGYLVFGAIVGVSGYLAAGAAHRLAENTGWSQSFVGSQFLAIATTLPEFTVAIAALRQGGAELALANQLGSMAFNLGVVLPSQSIASGSVPYLARISGVHAGTALALAVMALIVMWRKPLPIAGRAVQLAATGRGVSLAAIYVTVNYVNFVLG
jgi:cation:H+ antiporter